MAVVKPLFGVYGKDDRWNPADVWFYKDQSLTEIKTMVNNSACMDPIVLELYPTRKGIAIHEVKQMNELMLKMYEKII